MNMSKVGIGMFLNTYRQKKRGEKFIAVCGMDFEEIWIVSTRFPDIPLKEIEEATDQARQVIGSCTGDSNLIQVASGTVGRGFGSTGCSPAWCSWNNREAHSAKHWRGIRLRGM
jgi:hypothetical protein